MTTRDIVVDVVKDTVEDVMDGSNVITGDVLIGGDNSFLIGGDGSNLKGGDQ